MTREEKIKIMKSAGLRAAPTVMTFDMGLEYEYITPEGVGSGFGGMGSWPALAFGPFPEEKWNKIITAIRNKNLTMDMLAGTGLDTLADEVHSFEEVPLHELYEKLPLVQNPQNKFYSLFDTGLWYAAPPEFLDSKEELEKRFKEDYCGWITPWNELSDNNVDNWYEKLHDKLNEFLIFDY